MKHVLSLFISILFLIILPQTSLAQESKKSEYLKAKVIKIHSEKKIDSLITQEIVAKTNDKNLNAVYSFNEKLAEHRRLKVNDEVIITTQIDNNTGYVVLEKYRLTGILPLAILFILLVLIIARRKGFGSLIGLAITFLILIFFIVPMILKGYDPLLISIAGAILMMITTIYLSHGISQQTTIAVISTFLALIITGLLAVYFAGSMSLTGSGDEAASMLQFGDYVINLQGLLLGGIIIGTLGVLDDTTTTQSATIYTLAKNSPKLKVSELINNGLNIGTEHIASLVNTLVLAYAGVAMPLFIFFVINPLSQPWWVILNNEMILEEIVRTLTGSIGLIMAIPITTVLASFFSKYNLKIK